jgi:hypothetical protein
MLKPFLRIVQHKLFASFLQRGGLRDQADRMARQGRPRRRHFIAEVSILKPLKAPAREINGEQKRISPT